MPGPLEPTPAEIAALTEIIRRDWSEAEHRRRAGQEPAEWQTPVIAVAERSIEPAN